MSRRWSYILTRHLVERILVRRLILRHPKTGLLRLAQCKFLFLVLPVQGGNSLALLLSLLRHTIVRWYYKH